MRSAFEREVHAHKEWIGHCNDPAALLDRMAEYREDIRVGARTGNVVLQMRAGDLLELAEERIVELKAARLMASRAAAPGPADEADPVSPHEPRARRRNEGEERAPSEPSSGRQDDRDRSEQLRRRSPANTPAQAGARAHEAHTVRNERTQRATGDVNGMGASFARSIPRSVGGRPPPSRTAEPASPCSQVRSYYGDSALGRALRNATLPPLGRDNRRSATEQAPRALVAQAAVPTGAQSSPKTAPPAGDMKANGPRPTVTSKTANRDSGVRMPDPTASRPSIAAAPPSIPVVAGADERPVTLTGADVAKWRSDAGLTQRQAASRLGVAHGTVAKAELAPEKVLGENLGRALRTARSQKLAAPR